MDLYGFLKFFLNQGSGVPGVNTIMLNQVLTFTTDNNADTSSSSFADLTGMSAQNVTVPSTQPYVLAFKYKGHPTTSGSNDLDVQLVIGGATTATVSFPELELAATAWSATTSFASVTLNAGVNTVKPQFARSFGSQTIRVDTGKTWEVWIIG